MKKEELVDILRQYKNLTVKSSVFTYSSVVH